MGLREKLDLYGISRRDFLKFCSAVSATLALPPAMAPKVAEALESDNRPPVIWLEFQSCSGDSESLLRSGRPEVGELVLDIISLDYAEVLMAAAGHQAEEAKNKSMEENKGKYILVVEGAIPQDEDGVYCCIAGDSALNHLEKAAEGAAMIIAVGNCACYGGIPAGYPNPTGAVGVADLVKGVPVVNVPGCPMNCDNLTGLIVHYLLFGKLPALDANLRPHFAFGKRIHDNCERRAHFDAGQFVEQWGDEGHRDGWCLYKMGCKGPQSWHNCPTLRWNDGLSWPVMAGHGCVGCSEPGFLDTMAPFYGRLPNVPGFGVESTATSVGLKIMGAAAVIFGAHGIVSIIRNRGTVKKVEEGLYESEDK
ncbi:hydrogenase small subunit [Limisalsivibrio acetivorans]|uniref:hydrogenase small subunit n=1 Tax=Limisalsivibrio acetivorans TaxID=1304888 RepID=UPI0003B67318|nr:hydrogenase small subunit [Limisalsivibrio acetivorans]